MNFSKLNPKNWLKKPEKPTTPPPDLPPPARAAGQPKYRPGQRCLVLSCEPLPRLVGSEVYLDRCTDAIYDLRTGEQVAIFAWALTSHPTAWSSRYQKFAELWIGESNLLPIDDESLNKELEYELLETKPNLLVQET